MKRLVMTGLTSLLAVLALIAPTAYATSIVVNATGQGWIDQDGNANGSYTNNNYIAGNCGLNDCYRGEYRNFFQFMIPTLDGVITSASLVLNNSHIILLQGPSISYSVTSTPALTFATLGTGIVYGAATYTTADSHLVEPIDLTSAAFTDIFANQGGLFTISGRVTSPTVYHPTAPDQYVFGSSSAIAQLVIDTAEVPEPGMLALLGIGLVGLGLRRRQSA